MALNARNAENKFASTQQPSANLHSSDVLNTHERKQCIVNILSEIRRNDFVLFSSSGDVQIGKILSINNTKANIRRYFRKNELPAKLEIGESIIIHDKEVVESGLKSIYIEPNLILCKCQVFYLRVTDSIASMLNSAKFVKRNSKEMYVCRYKLVRKTTYKLLPVSWYSDSEPQDDEDTTDDENTNDNLAVHHNQKHFSSNELDTIISKLHLSSDINIAKRTDNELKLVSPIKIVNNSVQKIKRNIDANGEKRNETIEKERSPSKKAKMLNEPNANYLIESPVNNERYEYENHNKMSSVKKNLNSSFLNESLNDTNDDSVNEVHNYSVVEHVNSEKTMKMTLRKSESNRTLPLKEIHDNVTDTPSKSLRIKILSKNMNSSERTPDRRSILKTNGSSKNTPKRNVVIREESRKANIDQITNTPIKSGIRKSTRLSSINASVQISCDYNDPSPNYDAPMRTPKANKLAQSKSTENHYATPKSTSKRQSMIPKTPTNVGLTPQRTRQLFRSGNLTPSVQNREVPLNTELTELEMVRERLHVSAVPQSLPCRETEYDSIYTFVKGKVIDECGGCIYISGVPGTGKTATVTQVVRALQTESKKNKLPKFDYVEINGMRLTEPRQSYVQIYRQLTGKTMAWAQARDLLEKHFTETKTKKTNLKKTTILLIDELDIICNRKQDVVYNLFDWTAKKGSRLVAITIANTMDLPERVLKLKVASRLGLTRITFQPYTFKQLQQVVMARLAGSECFISDAVQLVARKVASISGDCRRALDICRRATEIAEETGTTAKDQIVKFVHVNQALTEMFTSPKVRAIKCCTKYEKLFLQAVASEITRTGIEEVDFMGAYGQLEILAPILGIQNPPTESQALQISVALGASRLLIVEDSSIDIYQKIILNVSTDDLYYALNC